jgi:signal transduction histidine kinase
VSEADFGRVCDNLVSNALAALGETGTIELRMVQELDHLMLTVTDDAGGMDESYLPFAFDRFSRENVARTHGGAGLGLSIVAGIASTSGGTVALRNSPGIGLEVDVTFPLVAPGS